MEVLGIIVEDLVNYKKIGCTILMPYCDFKCNHECGKMVCHNRDLIKETKVQITPGELMKHYYLDNPITQAIIFQGLEPFYYPDQLLEFIDGIREWTDDDIVIYTGYTEEECEAAGYLKYLRRHKNIIIKFGRFIPDSTQVIDDILFVKLASDNQYAKQIS